MLWEVLQLLLTFAVCTVLAILFFWFGKKASKKQVCVVVVGDIGRSPRMQYHALSFATEGFDVTLVGYPGSVPHKDIRENPKIQLKYLASPPSFCERLPRLMKYGIKVFWQILSMIVTLLLCPKPSYLLLQNPPALPSLAVCWFISLLTGSRFIIDWHNYGFTILGLAVGPRSPLVRIAKWYEKLFGRTSHANICVTTAMRDDLKKNWGIEAVTMYDRPPTTFQKTDLATRHELFGRLAEQYEVFRSPNNAANATAFTTASTSGEVQLSPGRPTLLISSTSWTEDEDFSILLNALQQYEDHILQNSDPCLPKLTCVITGKGPLKEYYLQKLAERSWTSIKVCTPWLEAEDYPKMLGSADLGVCLHKSSSNLDLPMKVVDMFGCGVPVCAVHFDCLDELVKHEENGMVFQSENELFEQMKELLADFPSGCKKLETFCSNLEEFQKTRWHETWTRAVLPMTSPESISTKTTKGRCSSETQSVSASPAASTCHCLQGEIHPICPSHQPRILSPEEREKLQKDSRLVSEFKQGKLEKEAQKNWDLFYKRNTTNFYKDRHWTLREFQELCEDQDGQKQLTVLEVGCGVGNFIFPLIEQTKHFFYACDFSPRAIEFVKENPLYNEDRCKAFWSDITASTLTDTIPESTLDILTMVFVLSAIHPEKMPQALTNIHSVLKINGCVLFRDYGLHDHAQLRFSSGHKLSENFYVRQDGTRAYYFSVEKICTLFQDAGFTVAECNYVRRETVNKKEGLCVPRVFIQAKFLKKDTKS